MTTTGYGAINPMFTTAKIVSSIGSFIVLLGFALVTGLLYRRLSKPMTKIKYSENFLIAPYKDGKALMFKMANQRISKFIESEVAVVFNDSFDGKIVYKVMDLELRRINFFALSQKIFKYITEDIPLNGLTPEKLEKRNAEIVILLKAFYNTLSQTMYSRIPYKYGELIWDAKFNSSIHSEGGKMGIHLNKLNYYTKL